MLMLITKFFSFLLFIRLKTPANISSFFFLDLFKQNNKINPLINREFFNIVIRFRLISCIVQNHTLMMLRYHFGTAMLPYKYV